MNRLRNCISHSLLLIMGVILSSVVIAHADTKPNFLIILCDDLGYGDLACYGNKTIRTPNLDKLASEGIKLTDCYASAPVCSPSRTGLLTGRTPNRVGVYDWIPPGHPMHIRSSEITVASLLKKAGYDTCHVGKWHCNGKFNSSEQPQPGDLGFDYWFSTQNNAIPSHHNPNNFVRNGKEVGPLEGYSCQLVAQEGIEWLKGRKDKAHPFFLHVCFHEPHEPIASPPDLAATYPQARNEDEAAYFANVSNMDREVGHLLKTLDELGVAKNTLVFFTSDNGPETLSRYPDARHSYGSPGPLRGMKLHIYEGGIRIPGIIRWPGHARPDQVVSEPVCNTDILPTFCEIAGVPAPKDRPLDGASFLSIFSGQPIPRTTPLFWDYYRATGSPKVAMRDGDWKIVALWDGPEKPLGNNVNPASMKLIKTAKLTTFELYNLREDMAERNNLAASEPERLKRMSEMLVKKFVEVQKEGPTWDVPEEARNQKKGD